MIKFSNVEDPDQYLLLKTFAIGTPDALALELKADPVEWLVNVVVSISNKLKTVMIHPDNADVDTLRCGPIKLKRSCGSVLC